MLQSSELRFARVLADYAKKHNFVALARAVSAANDVAEGEPDVIERRKLTRIASNAPGLVLSLKELHALDRYLEPLGEGLAVKSLFRRSNVVQAIADAERGVTFLLGSRPVGETGLSLDNWDVRAMTEILRGVGRFGPTEEIDIRDIVLHKHLKDARRSVTTGNWIKLLADDGPSLVVLGSGRASHAFHLVLSTMFATAPLVDAPDKQKLPFHFIWPDTLDHVFPSSFRYTARELAKLHPKVAAVIHDKEASALEIQGTVHLDRVKQKAGQQSYGVCVAQRRPGGQIWLVLAGVTGPATFAAAKVADGLALNLYPEAEGEASRVYWTPVRTSVRRDKARVAETFLVSDSEAMAPPQAWPGA